ncbi:hypothetical protein ABT236_19375 [Streptomyces sp. NPDC001523]|uniref:hypothetical protein n=1 Tax=Streptomyces sp. NPDC001523 TaxID=3154383 RepID=UPI00331C0405
MATGALLGHRVPGTKYRTLRTRIVGALSFSLVAGAAIGADLQLAQERHQRAAEGGSGHAEEVLEGQEGGGEGGRAEDETEGGEPADSVERVGGDLRRSPARQRLLRLLRRRTSHPPPVICVGTGTALALLADRRGMRPATNRPGAATA